MWICLKVSSWLRVEKSLHATAFLLLSAAVYCSFGTSGLTQRRMPLQRVCFPLPSQSFQSDSTEIYRRFFHWMWQKKICTICRLSKQWRILSTGPQWLKLWAAVICYCLFAVWVDLFGVFWGLSFFPVWANEELLLVMLRSLCWGQEKAAYCLGSSTRVSPSKDGGFCFYPSRKIQWTGFLMLCLDQVLPGTSLSLKAINWWEMHAASCDVCIKQSRVGN